MVYRLLDLFSGAGGSARGYQDAGFHVTGVDIRNQPRYVGDDFIKGDALEYLANNYWKYDAIHASPPCQSYLRVLRHRYFETNFALEAPAHPRHPLVFTHDRRKPHYGKIDQDTGFVQVTGGGNCTMANARSAMDCGWMRTKLELNEAIPPHYTEHVGRWLIDHLYRREVV